MQYRCTECGEEFDEPEIMEDDPSPAGISLPAGTYKYEVCPFCGSDYIEEIEDFPEEPEYFEDVTGKCRKYFEKKRKEIRREK